MLTRRLCDEFDDLNNLLYISKVSLMEIAIKNRDGKLPLGEDYVKFVKNIGRFGIKVLEIDNRHLFTLNRLTYPQTHKDPFDHLIVSQAITERLCLISADGKMKYYTGQGLELLENE
jgi:PIN domain nuclease of toxin-antitoxin system